MKKIYTLIACIAVTGLTFGQNSSPNVESFELPGLPACWSTINADGDGFDWSSSFDIEGIPGNTGSGSMASASYDNTDGALTPDNYLILPQLDIQADENLTFYVAGLDAAWSAEHYAVVLSTTGTEAADFTVSLLDETLSSADFVVKDIDLSAYVGQQVYIAFRHFDITDQFQMRIDDVQYPTTVNDCEIVILVGVEEAAAVEFNLFPNPSTGVVNISMNSTQDQLIEVYSLAGQVVFSSNYQATSGVISLDLSDLSKGIYTVNLTSEGSVTTEKLVLR